MTKQVGAWLCRALLEGECKAEPCPYPRAELAKKTRGRLGWHAVPTLPEAGEAVKEKGEPGTGKDARWA
jgi:hypothetical protein